MDLKGKVALVTGGANGIGLACVKELLRNGAQVALCDVDAGKGAAALRHLTTEFGSSKVIFIRTDVTNATEFENAFKQTISTFKSLDIVFNNAGIFDVKNWERMIDINIKAVVVGTDLAFKYMGKHEGGCGGVLCNTASIAGFTPVASMPVYVASKYAVVGLTRSYGFPYHMDKTGVRVVAICPGVTETNLFTDVTSAADELADQVTQILSTVPAQRPEDVAAGMMVVARLGENGSIWLCSHGKPPYELTFPPVQPRNK